MHAGWRRRSRVAGTQDVPRSRCDRQTVRGSRSIHGGSIPDRQSRHRLRRAGTLLEPARAARRPRGFASRRDLRRKPRVRLGPERRIRSRPRQVRSELEPRSTRHRAWEGEGSRTRALPPEQHARGRAAECRMTRTGTAAIARQQGVDIDNHGLSNGSHGGQFETRRRRHRALPSTQRRAGRSAPARSRGTTPVSGATGAYPATYRGRLLAGGHCERDGCHAPGGPEDARRLTVVAVVAIGFGISERCLDLVVLRSPVFAPRATASHGARVAGAGSCAGGTDGVCCPRAETWFASRLTRRGPAPLLWAGLSPCGCSASVCGWLSGRRACSGLLWWSGGLWVGASGGAGQPGQGGDRDGGDERGGQGDQGELPHGDRGG